MNRKNKPSSCNESFHVFRKYVALLLVFVEILWDLLLDEYFFKQVCLNKLVQTVALKKNQNKQFENYQYMRRLYWNKLSSSQFVLAIKTSTAQNQPLEVFCEKKVLLSLRKFYRKMPVFESPFNKISGLKSYRFMKKRLRKRCFPMKFTKFLRAPFLKNICERLSLCYYCNKLLRNSACLLNTEAVTQRCY